MKRKSVNTSAPAEMIKTLHLRVKDKHAKLLREQAREVNMVWNFCNETAFKILEREQRFCSSYDLDKLTSGASKELSIHSQTIQAIAAELATRRKQFKKSKLKWRSSFGSRRSLGWIPFKKSAIKYFNGQIHYQGIPISLWEQEKLSQYELGPGSFSEDSKGRWFFNTTVKIQPKPKVQSLNNLNNTNLNNTTCSSFKAVGVDLGLHESANTSDGQKLLGRNYRNLEEKLIIAQRAHKKNRVRSIHQKIKNKRKDEIHKFTTKLVQQNHAIFVGDIASAKLIKIKTKSGNSRFAKSTLDAGWGIFKTALEYKCLWAGAVFAVVNERYSTQTCSCCFERSGPAGFKDLWIREWTCSACTTVHDRDQNAAKNILRTGLCTLAKGTPCL